MKKIMCAAFVNFFLIGVSPTNAMTAWTEKAVPTEIESVRGQGFLIIGAFGNNGTACAAGDTIWVAITHPQYDQLYSMAISAMLSGKKLWGYAHQCTSYGWHGGTYNEITGAGALRIVR